MQKKCRQVQVKTYADQQLPIKFNVINNIDSIWHSSTFLYAFLKAELYEMCHYSFGFVFFFWHNNTDYTSDYFNYYSHIYILKGA